LVNLVEWIEKVRKEKQLQNLGTCGN